VRGVRGLPPIRRLALGLLSRQPARLCLPTAGPDHQSEAGKQENHSDQHVLLIHVKSPKRGKAFRLLPGRQGRACLATNLRILAGATSRPAGKEPPWPTLRDRVETVPAPWVAIEDA